MMIEVMPCVRSPLDQVEQMCRVVVVERRGGLVENEKLHVLRQCLGDLDQLLLADAELEHRGRGVLMQTHAVEKLGGLGRSSGSSR